MMVESLQAGDVAEAQALLDATECTCPNGMLWKGVFDGRGEWYKVHEWIVIDPEGIVEDEEDEDGKDLDDDDDEEEGDGVRREGVVRGGVKEGKGKEVEVLGDPVKVRCRLSTNGRDYIVGIHKGEKVAGLVAQLKAKAEVSDGDFPKTCSLSVFGHGI